MAERRRRRLATALLAGAAALAPGPESSAGDTAGERAFRKCYSCHSVEPGETAGLQGPNLRHLLGRPIAAQPGFDYSAAMRRFARRHGRWSPELLDRFLRAPEALVPGTTMPPPPPLDETERAALLEHLR